MKTISALATELKIDRTTVHQRIRKLKKTSPDDWELTTHGRTLVLTAAQCKLVAKMKGKKK